MVRRAVGAGGAAAHRPTRSTWRPSGPRCPARGSARSRTSSCPPTSSSGSPTTSGDWGWSTSTSATCAWSASRRSSPRCCGEALTATSTATRSSRPCRQTERSSPSASARIGELATSDRRARTSSTSASTARRRSARGPSCTTAPSQLAGALAARGVGPGDRVEPRPRATRRSSCWPRSRAWKLGAVPVPVRWDVPEWELDRVLDVDRPRRAPRRRRPRVDRRHGRPRRGRAARRGPAPDARHLQQRLDRHPEGDPDGRPAHLRRDRSSRSPRPGCR